MTLDQGTISANGLDFGYLATGPDDGPLALCLHGFPDTAHTYRHLLPVLADAGYRAVAPQSCPMSTASPPPPSASWSRLASRPRAAVW